MVTGRTADSSLYQPPAGTIPQGSSPSSEELQSDQGAGRGGEAMSYGWQERLSVCLTQS